MTVTERPVGTAELESSPPPESRGVRMSTVFTIAFAIGGAAIGMRPLHDNSFMWHLRTGELILDTHHIPHRDPFSFTAAGTHWVAQSWLAELLYGAVYRAAGSFGLRLLGGLVGALVMVAIYRIGLRFSRDRIIALGLGTLATMCLLTVWSERPLMLGLLAMAGVLIITEEPDTWLGRNVLLTLPVVMWLWANVHGTFSLGFAYLALHLLGRVFEGASLRSGRERKILEATAIAALVTFLNPYFIDLVLFPVHLLGARGQVLNGVEEWQSPNFRELGGQFFALWIVVMVVAFARKRPAPGVRDLLVSIAFVLLGLWAVRNVGLAVLVSLPVVARAVARSNPRPDPRTPINRLVTGLLGVTMLLVVAQAAAQDNWSLDRYPTKAVTALEQQGLLGRHLLTTDAWGGYVILTEWPKQQVFYDDRYDMYPLSVNASYDKLATLQPNWQRELDRYGVDVVMWPTQRPLAQGMALLPDWHEVYRDKTAVIYVKSAGA